MESTLKRTWAEIDLDALAYNYQVLTERMGPGARLLGVVKADAYGHGAIQVSRVLEELGAGYLAVSSIDEARELRLGGINLPILQLGLTPADQVPQIIENRVTQAVYSEESAAAFSDAAVRAGGTVKVHIKLDTGMSRLGFLCDEEHAETSLEAICRVCRLPGLEVEGIFTHFAAADEADEESRDFTLLQYGKFTGMIRQLEEKGVTFRIRHCANSGATACYPQFGGDLFRPGILTYGVGELAERLGLHPMLRLKTTVGTVQTYSPGATISYGRTFRLERSSRVGVLPIGYADGLPRALSNNWSVRTAQGMAPILGRICMDMCMVDLTDLPGVQEGDEVEIYGSRGSIGAAARRAGTIPYELLCAMNKRVPRVYLKNGEVIARELGLRG